MLAAFGPVIPTTGRRPKHWAVTITELMAWWNEFTMFSLSVTVLIVTDLDSLKNLVILLFCVAHNIYSLFSEIFYMFWCLEEKKKRRRKERSTWNHIQKFPNPSQRPRLQVAQLFATRGYIITIFWVNIVSTAALTLCVASERASNFRVKCDPPYSTRDFK